MIPLSFYERDDVVSIAKELIGKALYTHIDGQTTGGIIIETEAYRGPDDRACHAYNNRRTARTEVMFQPGGLAYVYLCYGMHNMLNVVTATAGTPHAILIRAITPTHGVDVMMQRRGMKKQALCSGPGSLCQALGITREHNGHPLDRQPLWIEESPMKIDPNQIQATPRIGIDYAGKDAELPWRFIME